MTVVWSMVPVIWSTTDRIFVNLDHFLPFYPPNNPENQKIPRDIIILHKFTENDIHMMYGSWDTERGRQNFLPFWTIFCPFTSLAIQKIKNSKKRKKCLEISSFYTSASKTMIICHTVPEIWHVMDVIFYFHIGLLLP